MRIDRPLTRITLIWGSYPSDSLAIVEPESYPIITDLDSRWQIFQFLTLLPLGSAINRVPFTSFQVKVVVKTLRNFPPPACLAFYKYKILALPLLKCAIESYL